MTAQILKLLGNKRGYDVLRNPLLNKGSAFTPAERVKLGLDGILPPQFNDMAMQAQRSYAGIERHRAPIDKYVALAALQDRNEHLFYRVVRDHIEEFMPIIYTPTVGQATREFSHVFQHSRGLWITPASRGRHCNGAAQCGRRASHPLDGGHRQRIDSRYRRSGRGRHRHLDRQVVAVHRRGRCTSGGNAAHQHRRGHRQQSAARRSAVSRPPARRGCAARSTTR